MLGCRKKKGNEIKDKETKIQKQKKIRRKIPDVGRWENETSDLIINERENNARNINNEQQWREKERR